MAIYPRATKQLIPPGASDPRIKARTGILHVDGGNAYNLNPYFDGPSGGIESHFHIPKKMVNSVKLFQYRDTAFEADANYHANSFAISFETQGFAEGQWTEHQITEIQYAMLWCRSTHDIPLRVMQTWDDPLGGWGYHTLFGSPSNWTPHVKSCPGDERKEQFHDLLVPWFKIAEDDMFSDEDRALLRATADSVVALRDKVERIRVREAVKDKRLRELLVTKLNVNRDLINEVLAEVDESV